MQPLNGVLSGINSIKAANDLHSDLMVLTFSESAALGLAKNPQKNP